MHVPLYELSTHIFFDILGFDGFKGVVRRIQRSKHKTVIKHTQTYTLYSKLSCTCYMQANK